RRAHGNSPPENSCCRFGKRPGRAKVPSKQGIAIQSLSAAPSFARGVLSARLEGHRRMLGWALTFLILALVAGFFGFFGLAGLSAGIAKILLFAFIVLFLISALSGA